MAIENNINIKSINSTAQPLSSSSISGSGSNVQIDMVDVKKQELLKRLNITADEYQLILNDNPSFSALDEVKQLEIVQQFKARQISAPAEGKAVEAESKPASTEFDRAAYNSMDNKEKLEQVKYEFAKNVFIYGIKDRDGNTVAGLTAHSPEEWANMSEEQKQQFINNLMNGMANDKNLAGAVNSIKDILSGNKENAQTALLDSTMRATQVANSKNMSFLEFFSLDEYEKFDATEEYLENHKDTLTKADKEYLDNNSFLKDVMLKSLSEHGVGLDDDASMAKIAMHAKYCNLDLNEEILHELAAKKETGNLSPREEHWFNELSKFNDDNGKNSFDKSKAFKLVTLKKEFEQLNGKLDSGELLSDEEQAKYNMLLSYFNSDEASRLEKDVVPNLKKAETDYEKSVQADINEVNNALAGYVNDNRIRTGITIKYLDNKRRNMSPEEWEKFLNTYCELNPDSSINVGIIEAFGNDNISLYKNAHLIPESVIASKQNPSEAIAKAQNDAISEASKSDNSFLRTVAYDANIARSSIAQKAGNDYYSDAVSISLVEMSSSGVYDQTKSERMAKDAVNVHASMKSPEMQRNAQKRLEKSCINTTNVRNYTTDNIGKFHAENQISIYNAAITGDKEAAAHASENGSVASMASENQNEAFDLLYDRLNEYFEGDDAVKYLNNLADQIPDCDKDNQLNMHNRMMGSQYQEVQEHAAGNIGNYDPAVQSDAMDTVYATGNSAAVEAAVNSLGANTAPDTKGYIQNEAGVPDMIKSAIQDKISSGAQLTPQEYASLSYREKVEYQANYFKNLPPAKQIKLLASISDNNQKKTIYQLIMNNNSGLFQSIIESSADTARFIYNNIDAARGLVKQTAERKAAADISYNELLKDINSDEEIKDPATENNLSKDKNYISSPDYLSGINSKNPKYELYPKDRYGNLIS